MLSKEEFLVEKAKGNFPKRLTYNRYCHIKQKQKERAEREFNALPIESQKVLISLMPNSRKKYPSEEILP